MFSKRILAVLSVLAALLFVSVAPALAQDGGGGKVIVGQSYVLAAGEQLQGDLAVLGGSALIAEGAAVNGNVAVAGGSLTVGGSINGDVAVFGGSVTLQETAVVEGDVATFGGALTQAEGAVITGQLVEGFGNQDTFQPPTMTAPQAPQPPSVLRAILNYFWQVMGAIGLALALAALGLLAMVMFPQPTERVANAAVAAPGVTFGVGVLTLLIVLGLAAILTVTICLAPIALLLMLVAAVAWVFSWVALGWLVGQRILEAFKLRNPSPLLEAILGIILITLLWRAVPCLGWLFWFIITALGLGAIVLTRFGTQTYRSTTATPPGSQPPVAQLPLAPAQPSVAAGEQALMSTTDDALCVFGENAEPSAFLSDLEDDLRAAAENEPPPA